MSEKVEILKGGWVIVGSVIAYPYSWQQPARTEEWIYESLKEKNIDSKFIEFICFPWATLIDLISRRKVDRANHLIFALSQLPRKKKLVRATACQHINLELIADYLISSNITDLFWSHKKQKIDYCKEIRLHPLALYPVAYFNEMPKFVEPRERKYLYSFVGAYDKAGYLDNTREKLFTIKHPYNSYVRKRDYWHFENIVYASQIDQRELTERENKEYLDNMNEYKDVLIQSRYSLCPSGAGVNSIRLWESILYGCIPVIFSPTFHFPNLNINLEVINYEGDPSSFDFNDLDKERVQNIDIKPSDLLGNLFKFFENSYILNLLKLSKNAKYSIEINSNYFVNELEKVIIKSNSMPELSASYCLEVDRIIRANLKLPYGINYSSSDICNSSLKKMEEKGVHGIKNIINSSIGIDDVILKAEEMAGRGDVSQAIAFAFKYSKKEELKSLSLLYANYKAINTASKIYFLNKYLSNFNQEIAIDKDKNKEKDFFYKIKSITKKCEVSGAKVTVIMPVFNAEKTIDLAVKSILNQTWRNLELIIVDDFSTDSSLSISKNFEKLDNRVKVYSMKSNVGPYACRNLGVIKASGVFITVHDADDWAFPDRLEIQVNALTNTNADACTGGMLRITSEGKITRPSALGRISSDGYLRLCFVSLIIRAEVFHNRLGAWDFVRVGGDAEMMDRINHLKLTQIHINAPLMLCLDNDNGLTCDVNYGLNSKIRSEYISAYKEWHQSKNTKYINIKLPSRNFRAPIANTIDESSILESYHFNGVL